MQPVQILTPGPKQANPTLIEPLSGKGDRASNFAEMFKDLSAGSDAGAEDGPDEPSFDVVAPSPAETADRDKTLPSASVGVAVSSEPGAPEGDTPNSLRLDGFDTSEVATEVSRATVAANAIEPAQIFGRDAQIGTFGAGSVGPGEIPETLPRGVRMIGGTTSPLDRTSPISATERRSDVPAALNDGSDPSAKPQKPDSETASPSAGLSKETESGRPPGKPLPDVNTTTPADWIGQADQTRNTNASEAGRLATAIPPSSTGSSALSAAEPEIQMQSILQSRDTLADNLSGPGALGRPEDQPVKATTPSVLIGDGTAKAGRGATASAAALTAGTANRGPKDPPITAALAPTSARVGDTADPATSAKAPTPALGTDLATDPRAEETPSAKPLSREVTLPGDKDIAIAPQGTSASPTTQSDRTPFAAGMPAKIATQDTLTRSLADVNRSPAHPPSRKDFLVQSDTRAPTINAAPQLAESETTPSVAAGDRSNRPPATPLNPTLQPYLAMRATFSDLANVRADTGQRTGPRLQSKDAPGTSLTTSGDPSPRMTSVLPGTTTVTMAPALFAQPGLAVDRHDPLALAATASELDLGAANGATQTGNTDVLRPAQGPLAPDTRLLQQVSQQLVALAKPLPDGMIEVTLRPEELGRVRMTLSPAEGGLSVMLVAEKPETLDLMRRHADVLAQDFKALGYLSVAFQFGEQGHQNSDRGDLLPQDSEAQFAPPEADDSPTHNQPTVMAIRLDGRMDLRL